MKALRSKTYYLVRLRTGEEVLRDESSINEVSHRLLEQFKRRRARAWYDDVKHDEEAKDSDGKSCSTLKEKQKYEHKNLSVAAICTVMYDCGVFVGLGEVYRTETKAQVAHVVYRILRAVQKSDRPDNLKDEVFRRLTHFLYDDVCHYAPFIKRIRDRDEILKIMADFIMKIDKMHVKNHKRKECSHASGIYNPYNDQKLEDVDTQVCEQENRWAGTFKAATKHMDEKAPVHMLRMSHLHNVRLTE